MGNPNGQVRMPFCRYRGMMFSEIPDDYLFRILDNTDPIDRQSLREAIRNWLGLDREGQPLFAMPKSITLGTGRPS
jgi:hypothetical protein